MALLKLKTAQLQDNIITNAKIAAGAAIDESKLSLSFNTTTLNNNITTVKEKKVLAYIEKTGISVGPVPSLDVTADIIAASFYDTYNGDNVTTGVVCGAPSNKVFLRDNSTRQPFEVAAGGADVYGRLTNAGSSMEVIVDFAALINPGDAAQLNSKFIAFQNGAGQDFYIWFDNEGGGVDPSQPGTGFVINGVLNADDGPAAVIAIVAEMPGYTAFTNNFTLVDGGSFVTITSKTNGVAAAATSDVAPPVTLNQVRLGTADAFTLTFFSGSDTPHAFTAPVVMDISFPESYNLNELPWSAFVNGLASSDTIGALPSHGHAIADVTGLQSALNAKVNSTDLAKNQGNGATSAATSGAALVGVYATGWSNLTTSNTNLGQVLDDIDAKLVSAAPTHITGMDLTSQVDDITPDVFVVNGGSYLAESLEVIINGSPQIRGAGEGFTESNPSGGEFTMSAGSVSGTDRVVVNFRR